MQLQSKTIEKLRKLINEETEYRSGPTLVSFFNNFGFNDCYGQGFPSRWFYTEEKLKSINGSKKLEDIIKHVLSPVNFIGRFDDLNKIISDFNQYLLFDGYKIAIKGKNVIIQESNDEIKFNEDKENLSEEEFINKDFKNISIDNIGLDSDVNDVIKQRLEEIKNCLKSKASLAVIFLCGSTLEGILFGVAIKNTKSFNACKSSPKDKLGKIKPFHEWTLNDFINTSRELNIIGEDVKKFSHALRDFRNYIHPYQQVTSNFNPDEQTAKICWQVLQAAIIQLSK
jgi:hypothetical protein